MHKIVCFGEIMMRLNPEGYMRFQQADRLMASYAGGEANVGVSLANYGEHVVFVSKVPKHEIGQSAVNALRKFGVDTTHIARGGERLGVYFVEKGASQRASKVIYDRKHSAISKAHIDDFDWDKIFEGCDWFHFTGITPALSEDLAKICEEALKAAKQKDITISCDLNYRKNLWSREQANEVMTKLMKYVNVCIANEEDAQDVFGISAENTDINSGQLDKEGYQYVAKTLMDTFHFDKVAITLRGSVSASDNNWSAMLYDGRDYHFANNYMIRIVDRVGGGDSFGGGLIYALLNGYQSLDAVQFAVAASCLKHTIEYDFNLVTVDEVKNLMKGNASGRVQR